MKELLTHLDDLPDEILIQILKKLHNMEVLYYLIDVNQRLNRIVHDSAFTSNLCLLIYCPYKNITCPLPDIVLDRFFTILPKIGHRIRTLCLEGRSMERILQATNYPNLYGLALYHVDVEVARTLFSDENRLFHILKNQISSFSITFTVPNGPGLMRPLYVLIFTQILTHFTNLKSLIFNPYSQYIDGLDFDTSPPTIIYPGLLELYIRVGSIDDCVFLLDGCFPNLRAFYVNIYTIYSSPLPTEHKKKLLPNLRSFSLHSDYETHAFNESVVPLLHRMTNLEELHLNLRVQCNENFIDGNTLKKDIIHMTQLRKLTFNICSTINHVNQTNFPTYEYIRKTFEDFHGHQLIICVDHFKDKGYGQCHIYTYPYRLQVYNNVTNNFPGGLFSTVHHVSLYDERPFEYEFFVRIAQSFPFMKELRIKNKKPQNDKDVIKSKTINQPLFIIKYPNLIILDVSESHDDYLELFLLDTKISLPYGLRLFADYEPLERVTYNFTRSATRNNCEELQFLYLFRPIKLSVDLRDYFPHTSIIPLGIR